MKILTIAATPYFSNRGCHIRIFFEAKHLQLLGNEVTLCTYHLGEDVGNFDIKRIKKTAWYGRFSPGFSWGKIWLDFKLLLLCIREIKKFQPDVIHAHLFEGLAVGFLAKKFTFSGKIPIVADLQGDLDNEFESYNKGQSFARSFFVWLSKIVIKWADQIVLSSENAKEYLRETYKQSDVVVVNDGIDLDFFSHPDSVKEEIQDELENIKKWKGIYKAMIYAGGMEDSKGIFDLLNEFVKVLGENEKVKTSWKLIMFGEGSDKQKYKNFIEQNNAGDSVFFTKETGFLSLPHFLKLADVGVDPKKGSTESSGKLASYMAAGLPVLCFENEFNRNRAGSNGIYFEKMRQFGNLLAELQVTTKVYYDLEKFNQKKETDKLLKIMIDLSN